MRFHSAQGCVRFFRVYVVLPAAVLLMAGLSVTSARGQIAGNTARDIRPLVQIETTPSIPTAVGIFDTGGTSLFIPPETNSRFNIAVAKNTAAGATRTMASSAMPRTSTSAAFLAARLMVRRL